MIKLSYTRDMNILGIETSCDETALSIINTKEKDNIEVLSNLVISQIATHAHYGGVFPALAKREHAKNIVPLLTQALKEAHMYEVGEHSFDEAVCHEILGKDQELKDTLIPFLKSIKKPKLDMIAVTEGPGLAPALWVGVNCARVLSYVWDIDILPVNHMEGHISSILLKENYMNEKEALLDLGSFTFPMIALLISGGHTQLILVNNWMEYEIIGETLDDAVGEAFDKVGRMLGMEYPGGPKVSQAAQQGKLREDIIFPRPMLHSQDFRFSFSGLKTAVRYFIQDKETHSEQDIADIARAFEEAVTEVLVHKTRSAIITHGAQGLIVAGGVSANTYIQKALRRMVEEFDLPLYLPEKKLCGDNSLMISTTAALHSFVTEKCKTVRYDNIQAQANLRLGH